MRAPERLAFLHTAAAHVPRFDAALAREAPGLRARHAVDAGLLAAARRAGGVRAGLQAALQDRLAELFSAGAEVVVCTCSTLGEAAEQAGEDLGRPVLRIDRPMAEQAVARASRLLVVAALESALPPTLALLRGEAARAGREVTLDAHVCVGAFAHFEAGDAAAYCAAIADSARAAFAGQPGLVLAQVSMADAAPACADLGTEVFCAVPSGIVAALAMLETSAA